MAGNAKNVSLNDELIKLLKSLKETEFKNFNIFDAVGMTTQETKHSYFLAWLMNPQKPHPFGKQILHEFFDSLYDYKTNPDIKYIGGDKPKSNKDIIDTSINNNGSINNKLLDILNNTPQDKIIIEREYPTDLSDGKKGKRRIDVLIELNDTVVVIENKVFAGLSQDQLKDYYDYICLRDVKYKNFSNKIFVFLTPNGDLPNDGKNYDDKWCVYNYQLIVKIIEGILKGKTIDRHLKKLMGDYCDMARQSILKDGEKWELISKFTPEILDLANSIKNKTKNLEYCRDWLSKNIVGYVEDQCNDASFRFHTQNHTQNMESYFGCTNNGKYDYKICSCYCGSNAGLGCVIDLYEGKSGWTPEQQNVINKISKNGANAKGHITYGSVTLLTNEEWLKDFSVIKNKLIANLEKFKKNIEDFEKLL